MIKNFWKGMLLFVATFVVFVGLIEITCRSIQFDFAQQERRIEGYPIYFRKALEPTGEVFFRRSGPDQWEGQVLRTAMTHHGIDFDAYTDERSRRITYDQDGFRNPDNLMKWDIAVAGDSFTELGYLDYQELFTTVAMRRLNTPIRNLGVSHTGMFSQIHYIEEFGDSPDLKHGLIVFYEGNDLIDSEREYQELRTFHETGERPIREIVPQSSFVRKVISLVKKRNRHLPKQRPDAYLPTSDGEKIPLTLAWLAMDPSELTRAQREIMDVAFETWADTAKEMEIKPWVVFVPTKLRVLFEHLEFHPRADPQFEAWQPNALPLWIESLSIEHGIAFIDTTPALVEELQEGNLPYNSFYDPHLSSAGSRAVGEVIANHLKDLT